ncbi:MAG TPA: hypothetical protein DCZ43_09375, partial [candidate division Zixibacteria bacterium]|nr:hypothetical protein [candidate division Zixibacteria bacterium]
MKRAIYAILLIIIMATQLLTAGQNTVLTPGDQPPRPALNIERNLTYQGILTDATGRPVQDNN